MNTLAAMRLAYLRRAEDDAFQELQSTLSERAETLRGLKYERSCDYGHMARHEIRIALAGVRAMRFVIKSIEREQARDKANVELDRLVNTSPREPIPQELLDAAFAPYLVAWR